MEIHNDTGKLIKMYPKELTDRTIKFYQSL